MMGRIEPGVILVETKKTTLVAGNHTKFRNQFWYTPITVIITKLSTVFESFDSEEAAVASFREVV